MEVTVPYTVCYAFDKQKERTYAQFLEDFGKYMHDEQDFIFSRQCYNTDPNKDNRYMVVIRKNINDELVENENFTQSSNIGLKRYRSRPINLHPSILYGFFIKTDKIDSQKIFNLFNYLQNKGFIHPDSYTFHYPQNYPNGTPRKYIAITFEKDVNGNIPKGFINKLKTLLSDTEFDNGEKLKINWLQKSVFNDIKHGRKKNEYFSAGAQV